MKILVTAGPTYEFWDSIRFLSNLSSGKMGYAIAAAACQKGHRVCLISGPTCLQAPRGVRRIQVTSAREMDREVRQEFLSSDAVIMAAAVCDFRPAARRAGKIKKKRAGSTTLRLIENPDILASLGKKKGRRILVGFALEAQHGLSNAQEKLVKKNLDAIVLNGPAAMNADRATVTVLRRDGQRRTWRTLSKLQIGRRLVEMTEKLKAAKP